MLTMDKAENIVPPAEEEQMEEEGDKEEEKVDQEEGKQEDDGPQESGVEKETKEEAVPPAAAQTKTAKKKKKNPFPVKTKEKRPDEGLNLNNEVVRMRKEVKRVRALIFRKMTRQVAALKKMKGTEMEIEKNKRRAARLLEEVHAMKGLSPDVVTKTALQRNLNFEHVCKNPKSDISDRATARIATHPQFQKKIEAIKAAVKAFKEERTKGGKQAIKEKPQNKPLKLTPQTPEKQVERKSEKVEEEVEVERQEVIEDKKVEDIVKNTDTVAVVEPEKGSVEATPSADVEIKEMPESKIEKGSVKAAEVEIKETPESKIEKPAAVKVSEEKDDVKNTPKSNVGEKKPETKPAPDSLQETRKEVESDLEISDGEEKEYFDDSTEERFHKQSSLSEESDDDGGFFVGKVRKCKRKRKQKSGDGEKAHEKSEAKSSDPVQSELDELEARLRSKKNSFQSVFCPSLSSSGGGRGRGRGGDRFMSRGNPRGDGGPNRAFRREAKFQNQEEDGGGDRNAGSKPSEGGFRGRGRGRGDFTRQGDRRGRGDFTRQGDRRGRGAHSQQPPEEALHPSWEASRRRKEQQGQILAFQGKKIKFAD
ncbi:serum response factor-binding protein 1 isoform X2 [Pseudochaenichthys georgianus]|uniref:serum response factor-binding protein 1 isoform X2 n=1 Tax=Pseudochaenichthys georgianus TaxID=52239 RepID=UPI00146AF2E0|nr:serum response factor-binding protein 1 isoform X2 [Pseudochaenichthys georgianus]